MMTRRGTGERLVRRPHARIDAIATFGLLENSADPGVSIRRPRRGRPRGSRNCLSLGVGIVPKQTVTFHNATLVSSAVDWTQMPPAATLLVRAPAVITPHQVSLLEAFAFAQTKQRLHLIIFDERVVRVTAADGER